MGNGKIVGDEDGDAGWALGHYETTKLLFKEFPKIEEVIRREDQLMEVCAALLVLYPEPKQFKVLVDLLGIDNKQIIEWSHKPMFLMMPIMGRHTDNLKYVLSMIGSKKDALKILNSPLEDEEEVTLLQATLGLGGGIKTLLMAFDLEQRLELIEKGNLMFFSIAMEKVDVSKMIIETIEGAPKQQLTLLTQPYNEATLMDYAQQLGAEQVAAWIQKKIKILQTKV